MRRGFTLAELLIVVGLTALIAVPLGHLMRSAVLIDERGADEAKRATLLADALGAIGDDVRAARSASSWTNGGVELALEDRDVRYAAAKDGVYRAVRPAGGSWTVDPAGGFFTWSESGSLRFTIETDGAVTIDLTGDDISFRTAVFPRGEYAATLPAGGGSAPGGGPGDNGNNGNHHGSDGDNGNEGNNGNNGDGDRGRGNDGGRGGHGGRGD